jgi:hypothetical protein
MGHFSPVFQKAGMKRIGEYGKIQRCQEAIKMLESMGVDPRHRDFLDEVRCRPAVFDVVREAVRHWYAATTGTGAPRVEHQPPELLAKLFRAVSASSPVYYLWRRSRRRRKDDAALAVSEPERRSGYLG